VLPRLLDSLEVANPDDSRKFPVKFPVCRENVQSRVRIPLRRQPASVVSANSGPMKRGYARRQRASCLSSCLLKLQCPADIPDLAGTSLRNHWEIPVFFGARLLVCQD
jgi:hypothetical protein